MNERHTEAAPLSRQTVYRWVRAYSKYAFDQVMLRRADVDSLWMAVEIQQGMREGGSVVWFVMDLGTRYILACHLSESRNAVAAGAVLDKAIGHAVRAPTAVLADVDSSYNQALKQTIPECELLHPNGRVVDNLPVELRRGLEKQTARVRRFRDPGTALGHLEGWIVFHNFFGGHPPGKPTAPGDDAAVGVSFNEWAHVVRLGPSDWGK